MANKKCGTCCPQNERPMDGLRAGNSLLWDRMADQNHELYADIEKVKENCKKLRRAEAESHEDEMRELVVEMEKAQAELAKEKELSSMRSVAHSGDIASCINENRELHIELDKVRDELADIEYENRKLHAYAQEAGQEAGKLYNELADANSALEKAVAELGALAPYVTAGLLPALDACGSVLLYGQQKYPANDWADICPEEHNAAILRHMGSKAQYDHESEQLHSAHVAARALMALGTELPYAQD